MQRKKEGNQYKAHGILNLIRFGKNIEYMILFHVISAQSFVRMKEERIKLYLVQKEYENVIKNETEGMRELTRSIVFSPNERDRYHLRRRNRLAGRSGE